MEVYKKHVMLAKVTGCLLTGVQVYVISKKLKLPKLCTLLYFKP